MPKRRPDFAETTRGRIEHGPAPDSRAIPDAAITLLYEDAHLLAVSKPSGLLSVPGKTADKADCLITRLQVRWPTALTVHRLDQATSGVMVVALGKDAQRALSMAFQARSTLKVYEAVVDGLVSNDRGTIDAPIGDDLARRPLRFIDPAHGRASVTHYEVLRRDELANTTTLRLTPETGRTHQLRVHLAHLGHAILGDHLYASAEVYARAPRLMLHAAALSLNHPATGATLKLEAPWPTDAEQSTGQLGFAP
jgi:tRNA pseudouridine32 synthase / 23S rRNA pseudouridine746 synthase